MATILSTLSLALLASTVYYTIASIKAWHKLRHFRGPLLAKFSYTWEAWAASTGNAVQIYADALKAHGQLARIAPDVLLTNDPDAIRRMASARGAYRRSEWYSSLRLDPRQHSMFSSPDVAYHDAIKARTGAGYGGREVPGLERDVDDVLGRLRRLIRTRYLASSAVAAAPAAASSSSAEKGGAGAGAGTGASAGAAGVAVARPTDFSKMAHWFTLDSLGRIAFGLDFGHLEEDADVHSIVGTAYAIAPMVQMCTEIPILRKIIFSEFMIRLVGPKPTDQAGIGKLQGLAKTVVSKRFGSDAEQHNDMLGSFIRHGLTESECENEVLLQFIAGSDTISTVMRATMLYLMTNVVVYKKLQAEIDRGVSEGAISTPVTGAEARALPYLTAVIQESMRIHPAASPPFLKVVPPGGDVICGRRVPGGTQIASSLWSLLRRRDIFGEDADVFRPERWLDGALPAEKKKEMGAAVDLNFGYGRWSCAGKQIAVLELYKVFVELLRYFDFQLVNPAKPWEARNHSLFYVKNMWVTVTERTDV